MSKEPGMIVLAIQKVGNIPNWHPYYFKSVIGGVLIRGCLTTLFKRGPRKGQRKYLLKEQNITVVISAAELHQWAVSNG